MREQIDTIPVNEAFSSNDECPFCYLERQAEQRAIRYTVGPGASYMEPEVRGTTDRLGFCAQHMKKLYDYGNALGNALILQTYYVGLIRELDRQLDDFEIPPKKPCFPSKSKNPGRQKTLFCNGPGAGMNPASSVIRSHTICIAITPHFSTL